MHSTNMMDRTQTEFGNYAGRVLWETFVTHEVYCRLQDDRTMETVSLSSLAVIVTTLITKSGLP